MYLSDYVARWAYIYGPILFLIIINVVLFVMVAVTLVKQKRELARVLQNNESQSQAGGAAKKKSSQDRERLVETSLELVMNLTLSSIRVCVIGVFFCSALLCGKLFLVMGITWLMEVLSFVIGATCYAWLATDLMNCLRGFFIFMIFVKKKDVIKKVP